MLPRQPLALIALLFALSACSQATPTTVTKFEHFTTPAELRDCKPEPTLPALKSDAGLANYILNLRGAGSDCRDKLAARNKIEDADK